MNDKYIDRLLPSRYESKYPESEGDWIDVTRLGDANLFRFSDLQSLREAIISMTGEGFQRKDGWKEKVIWNRNHSASNTA